MAATDAAVNHPNRLEIGRRFGGDRSGLEVN
jgi:hypothetical protein